ncbi:LPS export ABC transporter permease LptF [Pseudooceanicola nanhaiensis]|nr:LPS export ABC transporter permease LptF [Pseudooceanicola nanhaiensis]
MARFDRYMLSQLLVLFGFFALILISIYWINSAVRLFDRLIADGQTALVFLELSALTLPKVVIRVLPFASFAAAIYVTNRLSNDSELVVVQATGYSPFRLARPVLSFGVIVFLMGSVLTQFLVPVSERQMAEREDAIARNVSSQLLTEGTFLHPTDGITFFIREISPDGTLRDVFLSDRRDPAAPQTFTAAQAYLLNTAESGEDPRPQLVMVNGLSQMVQQPGSRLFTTHFADFTYDISGLLQRDEKGLTNFRYMSTLTILSDPAEAARLAGTSVGRVLEEAHGRFSDALLCLATAMIGFAAMMQGSFSRFGMWRQIGLAMVLLVVVKGLEGMVTGPLRDNPTLWGLMYVPTLAGLMISTALLWFATRTRHPRRRRQAEAGA